MEKRTGRCHCKRVKYEVNINLSEPALECNCSHCQIKGLLLSFVPAEQFTLLAGADDLATYKFNKERIAHMFCKNCGVQPFGKGSGQTGPMVGVNVRTIDDIDLNTVTRKPFNGKDL